ncbi:MAG: trypsin-like peptidase domain-containing protein [Leptolyngbyaceae cyanobacterium bins.349]|nr:trypsin-like peptidase domain-containing protein [Leptolyngbyaceae cyanobacterium bins.349]
MKLHYLLPFAAAALFINPMQIVESAPAQMAYETRSQTANQIYQQVNPAIVTVYAGREIGSGSIVTANGLVITNNHVVRGVAQVYVRTAEGRRIPGQVISTDSRYDLALIQLNTSESLPTVQLSNGAGIQPGQPVVAIGSPYGRPGVMTQGTFASMRSNGDLQSRVTLEPGNSGGPLLNTQGEMIGINKAILESARGANTGISISTSAAIARSFIERSRPGALTASVPPYRAQPQSRYSQTGPNSAVAPFGSNPSAIARVPGSNFPAQPNNAWGTPTNQPMYQSGGYESGGYQSGRYQSGSNARVNSRPNEVVIPGIVMPWQTAQIPDQVAPGYNTTPEYGTPPGSAPIYPDAVSGNPTGVSPNPVPAPVPSGARLGVIVDTRTMIIQQVAPGAPGANSGLRVGDRLLAVNGTQLNSFAMLEAFMNQAPPVAAFTIARSGRTANVQVRF